MRYNQPKYTASKILKSPTINEATVSQIAREVKHECELLCKIVPIPSQFRVKSINDMLHLNWKSMMQELKTKAPILTAILEAASQSSSSRGISDSDSATICAARAILL